MEKVSVILPVYNSENTIEKAILSVINQEYENKELIIIDDGSTDKTSEICKKYCTEGFVKYFYNSNSGVSYSRNFGIRNATGKYLMFLDSDDTFKKNYISKMVSAIEMEYDWAICWYERIGKNKVKVKKIDEKDISCNLDSLLIKLIENNLFNQLWNKIYKLDIIKLKNIFFDESKSLGEDLDFNLEYLKYVDNICCVKDVLYTYTNSTNGLNLKYNFDRYNIKIKNIEKMIDVYKYKKLKLDYPYMMYVNACFLGIKNANNLSEIEKIINNDRMYSSFKLIQNNIHVKQKILISFLRLKNKYLLYFMSFLLKKMDVLYKKIKLGY